MAREEEIEQFVSNNVANKASNAAKAEESIGGKLFGAGGR
jgi:hypothetical protein